MNDVLTHYKKLKKQGTEIDILNSILKLLQWDQQTILPKRGTSFRSEQISLLSSLIHAKKTDPNFKKTLAKCMNLKTGKVRHPKQMDTKTQMALTEFRKGFLKETKLPHAFVKKWAKATTEGLQAWEEAKKANAFKIFLPSLKTIIALAQKKAELFGYQEHPYDALLDLYEPGMTVKKLDSLFETLQPFLKEHLQNIAPKKEKSPAFLSTQIPQKEQIRLFKQLLKIIGLQLDQCDIGTSPHPFCFGIHHTDVRLTIRSGSTSFFSNLFALMHEAGHALYEQNLPYEHFGTPLRSSCSMGIHESQSRFWECFIGKSHPFWEFLTPKIAAHFPKMFGSLSADSLYHAVNQVKPSCIRISADEISYMLHVMIRYDIEKKLLTGSMCPEEIPKIWNAKMKNLLGIVPQTDQDGCLQDIHWSIGCIGYFPTYALGNLYAAQLFDTFQTHHPHFEKKISNGDFSEISLFLFNKIHRHGKKSSPLDLIEQATGSALSPDPYVEYLKEKHPSL